jgi:hypothetical protein
MIEMVPDEENAMTRHNRSWTAAVLAGLAALAIQPSAAQQNSDMDMKELLEQWASDERSGTYRSPEDIFDSLDADGNGEVTSQEVPSNGQWFVERFDRDGGGVITGDEINREVKDAITRQANRDDTTIRQTGPRALFERSAPQVGTVLPEISGHNSDGEAFNLSSLKGNYSVLVFGCLT